MTIKDLAAQSGYSLGTVSRVLNGQPNVSEKARQRILAVAEAQGFAPNLNARQLKQNRGNDILVVVKGVRNELFAGLVERLQGLAVRGPYPLVVDYIDELDDEVREAQRLIRERKPRGVLFLGGSAENFSVRFRELALPAVLVTNSARELGIENLSSVTTDDAAAARAAIDHLLDMGHRAIGVIGGDRERSDTSALRFAGCCRAYAERGLRFDAERYYRTARYSFEGGRAAMDSLLADCPELTAVFAMADVMIIGAARAVRDAGRAVPEDISLIGFDGLPICGFYEPRLATVVQQTDYMAEESYAILLRAIDAGESACHRLVPFRLEKNESVRRLI